MNILQHCAGDFITEPALGYLGNTLVSHVAQQSGSNLKGFHENNFCPICYVARACVGKAVKSLAWLGLHPIHTSCHCRAEPNSIYCIQEKNNRMYLIQQDSGLATAQHINWVLNPFLAKILEFAGWKSDKPLPFANFVFPRSNVTSNAYFCKTPLITFCKLIWSILQINASTLFG